MDAKTKITLPEFREKLDAALLDAGDKELVLKPQFLKDYCRLTGHDYAWYQSADIVPAGFLMTFTAPLISEVFIAFFARFPGVIKGVVHSSSQVAMHAPFCIGERVFRLKIDVDGIVEKAGKKGRHFVVDLEAALLKEDGAGVLTDMHQFFLRV